VQSIITDSPYSARTHAGRRTGSEIGESGINYAALTVDDVFEFVRCWDGLVDEWWVFFGDDESVRWWRRALRWAGKYVFPAVPWVKPDAAPRFSGDGPSSATEYICVARERHMPTEMGSRPGYYMVPTSSTRGTEGPGFPGSKPLWLWQALLRDYSSPGRRVADPYMGWGTSVIAGEIEGREIHASEVDPDTYAKATARIARAHGRYTPVLPGMSAVQLDMLGGAGDQSGEPR
jgi:hypothetical protein